MDLTFEDAEWVRETFELEPGVLRYFEGAAEMLQPLREAVPLIRKAYPTERLLLHQDFLVDATELEPDPPPIIVIDKEFAFNPDGLPAHRLFLDAPEVEAESQRLWAVLGDDGYGRAEFFFRLEGETLFSVHFTPFYADDFEGTKHDPYAGMTEYERKQAEAFEQQQVKDAFIERMSASGFTVTDLTKDTLEMEQPTPGHIPDDFTIAIEGLEDWLNMRRSPPKEGE